MSTSKKTVAGDGTARRVFQLNDKLQLKHLREMIEENLAEAGREYGLTFKAGNISYEADGRSCKVRLEVASADESGQFQNKDVAAFKKYGFMFGLTEEDLGAEFKANGKTYKVVGLQPKRRRFPILVQEVATGKRSLMTEDIVKRLPRSCAEQRAMELGQKA